VVCDIWRTAGIRYAVAHGAVADHPECQGGTLVRPHRGQHFGSARATDLTLREECGTGE